MTIASIAKNIARRRPEPEARRSHQKVRRGSRMASDVHAYRGWESGWIRPMTMREKNELIRAAVRYDDVNKKPGDRHGPLGPIAIRLLEELCFLAVANKGRVYPSLNWMQKKIRRSRDTIVRVMRALADAKILEWVRRIVPKEGSWERGPQVEQTSSIYRISLPKALRGFVKRGPPAADEAQRKAEMQATIAAYIRQEAADELDAIPAVARANAKAAAQRRALERESDDQAETVQNLDLKGVR